MYLHLFLMLFSTGASGYFLPPKEMRRLQNTTKYAIIDEMLCLLEAEKESINETFIKPLHVKIQSCAHNNTEKFIEELQKIPKCKCMKIVENDLKRLEESCSFLKKSSSNDSGCSVMKNTTFSQFKKSLEEFLKWVNGNHDCNIIMRSELALHPDSKCNCSDSRKYRDGLL